MNSHPDPRPSSSGWRRPAVWALAVLVVAGGAYGGWRALHRPAQQQAGGVSSGGGQDGGGQTGGGKAAKVPVTVAEAKKADFPVYLTGLGTVEAFNTVTVRPQVGGEIQTISFRQGQLVQKGDLLAQIDPRPLQAALAQAKAKLAQDQSGLRDADTNLQRYGQLAQQQFVSRQQLDTQASTVNQIKAGIEGDEAAISNAETQLSYATIRAPISGRVGFRLVDEGNVVSAGETSGIVTIQQVTPISVLYTAPEEQLGAIVKALNTSRPPVWALSSDGQTTLAKGTLGLLNNEVDTASGTVRLKARFENADGVLWPGLSVATRMMVDTLKGVITVPADAVQHGPDGLYVYVVGAEKKAEMRKIQVSNTDGGQAVVRDGLKGGEQVVIDGQYRIQPGVILDPKPAKDLTPSAGGAQAQAGPPGEAAAQSQTTAPQPGARSTAQAGGEPGSKPTAQE